MDKICFKVRASPATILRNENEDFVSPLLHLVLTFSIFSCRAMSHGGMKLKFITDDEKSFKDPPSQQRRKEE